MCGWIFCIIFAFANWTLQFAKIMNNNIEHLGVVDSIDGICLKVRIQQMSACSSCKVAKHCSASEQKTKYVDVYDAEAAALLHVGDEVKVKASLSAGYQAVWLGFGVPLLLMLLTILLVANVQSDETVAALAGIAILLPYYIVLYFLRDKLRRKFTFRVEKN